MDDLLAARREMVEKQLRKRGLGDTRLLRAFEEVPRHLFVPTEWRKYAYQDRALPIGQGQTISQPYIVALMTSLLDLDGTESVLEVGTGSGYQAAILSRMCAHVHTIEYDAQLAQRARSLLEGLGYNNISFRVGDGSAGWPEAAPFEGILVTAFAERVPSAILEQLREGSRLVMPVGSRWVQTLERWTRVGDGFEKDPIIEVNFVPLRGGHGSEKHE